MQNIEMTTSPATGHVAESNYGEINETPVSQTLPQGSGVMVEEGTERLQKPEVVYKENSFPDTIWQLHRNSWQS